jgi:hypothetical protein
LLALQRRAGNQVVQRLVATVQRCGGQTHEGCPCAETADEAPVVARQDAGAPPPCNAPGTLRVPGSPVDSVAAAVAANCLDEAYGILNARMLVAIKAVDLHAKGGPVTGPDLRDLIDQMGGLPPDQRRDILRFIGKYAVITVRGLDCKGAGGAGCVGAVTAEMKWAAKMQGEYAACRGKPGVKVAADVEKCVASSLAKQAFEAADKWITDDVNAYGAEIPFYKEVLSAIATLEGKI